MIEIKITTINLNLITLEVYGIIVAKINFLCIDQIELTQG